MIKIKRVPVCLSTYSKAAKNVLIVERAMQARLSPEYHCNKLTCILSEPLKNELTISKNCKYNKRRIQHQETGVKDEQSKKYPVIKKSEVVDKNSSS